MHTNCRDWIWQLTSQTSLDYYEYKRFIHQNLGNLWLEVRPRYSLLACLSFLNYSYQYGQMFLLNHSLLCKVPEYNKWVLLDLRGCCWVFFFWFSFCPSQNVIISIIISTSAPIVSYYKKNTRPKEQYSYIESSHYEWLWIQHCSSNQGRCGNYHCHIYI